MAPCAVSGSLEAVAAVRDIRLAMKTTCSTMRINMALEAQQTLLTTLQQEVIYAAVRSMAGSAAFNSHNCVLINEGPTLFHMALDARFPIGVVELEVVHCTVRVVAVRALHKAFAHPVMLRQCKLRLDGPMAGIAEFRLRLF